MALEVFEMLIPIEAHVKLKLFQEHLFLQLKKGGGTMHKFVSKSDKEYMNVDFSSLSKDNISPEPFLEEQCKVFGKFWNPKVSAMIYQKLLQNLRDFRKHAISQVDSSQRTPYNYKKAIHSYKKDTVGGDSWKISTLQQMPDVIITGLAEVDKLSYELVAVPHQSLLSLGAVLGKPSGGIRTICKTGKLYIVSNLVSTSVTEWEQSISSLCKYDTARKGSNALDAALHRGLIAEVAFWLQEHFVRP